MTHTVVQSGRLLDGRYELQAMIGQGTFGRVYRGVDQRLARPVAVKLIKPWWTEDPEWARRFEQEAQLMARVNHPGIVQIYDIGHAEDGLYYVAELVEGESLAERLRRGALAPGEALAVAEQLCRALAQAHAQRVVHRDVKPGNVLLAADGRVKVGDFGIARLAEGTSEGPAGTVVGTPRYMAPEQARGRATTPATDVYGVGVVLYEMLAGRPPFDERSAVELALRHLNDPPPPLPAGTAPALAQIVERALAKEPGERYPTASEMADALAGVRAEVAAQQRAADRVTAPRRRPPDTLAPATVARAASARTATAAGASRAPDPTRVRARMAPRRVVNPSEARRYHALLGAVVLVVVGLIAAALLSAGGSVTVPRLSGLTRAGVTARLHVLGLHAAFGRRHSVTPAGLAIAQSAPPGTRVGDGTTVRVTLSSGPPPVPVPQVTGQPLVNAQAILSRQGLGATVSQVAAPGVTPGLVVQQTPPAATDAAPHSSVALAVAETPRWRSLTSFAADGDGHSVPFQIRGSRWRLVYTMGYDGTCTLLFICSGPSAQVTNVHTGATTGQFDLNEGSGQTQVFNSGPGVYEVNVTSGSDSAHWTIQVQDDY